MKRLILILAVTLAGCAPRVITPLPPENAHNSSYRKTIEVIAVSCRKINNRNKSTMTTHEYSTIVESTATGERFEVWGCYGDKGDRFKVSY